MPIQSIANGNFTQLSPISQPSSRAESERAGPSGTLPPAPGAAHGDSGNVTGLHDGTEYALTNGNQNSEAINKAVEKLNDFVNGTNTNVVFSVDQDTNLQVIKVTERGTDKVIRQIPSQEALQIAKVIDKLQGLLVQDKA